MCPGWMLLGGMLLGGMLLGDGRGLKLKVGEDVREEVKVKTSWEGPDIPWELGIRQLHLRPCTLIRCLTLSAAPQAVRIGSSAMAVSTRPESSDCHVDTCGMINGA